MKASIHIKLTAAWLMLMIGQNELDYWNRDEHSAEIEKMHKAHAYFFANVYDPKEDVGANVEDDNEHLEIQVRGFLRNLPDGIEI